jgi:hypothetical protein
MNSRITQINKQNTIYENIKKSKKYFKIIDPIIC